MSRSHVIRMPATMSGYAGSPQSSGGGGGGIQVGCCRVCTCVQLGFLTSKSGMLKLFEFIFGSFCETILMRYGMPAASDIGQAFNSFVTTVSACMMTTALLLLCYILSAKSYSLEVLFNATACCLYFSASSYMGIAVHLWLYPRFLLQTAYMAYPAMTLAYYIGILMGLLYGMDAFLAWRHYRGYR